MTSLRMAFPTVLLTLVAARPMAAQAAAPKAESREETYITEKGFAGRVFDVKHRDPFDIAAALRPLGSGYRGAAIQASREFKTVTVRDFPENIAAIEGALKRLDVAEGPRPDVELKLWVLVASHGDPAGPRIPDELKDVVGALKATLAYKSYTLAGAFVQRTRDGARGIRGEGVTDLVEPVEGKGPRHSMQLEFGITELSMLPQANGPASLKLDGFSLSMSGGGRAQLRTDVLLKDGERVVVGTSTMQDRGLIVVISARVIS